MDPRSTNIFKLETETLQQGRPAYTAKLQA